MEKINPVIIETNSMVDNSSEETKKIRTTFSDIAEKSKKIYASSEEVTAILNQITEEAENIYCREFTITYWCGNGGRKAKKLMVEIEKH